MRGNRHLRSSGIWGESDDILTEQDGDGQGDGGCLVSSPFRTALGHCPRGVGPRGRRRRDRLRDRGLDPVAGKRLVSRRTGSTSPRGASRAPASPGPQGRTTTALSGHWVGPPAPRADHPTRPTSRDPGRFAERTVAVLALGFRGNPKSPWTNLQPKGEPGRLVGDEETAPMTETFPDTAWGSLHLSGFPPRGNDNAS